MGHAIFKFTEMTTEDEMDLDNDNHILYRVLHSVSWHIEINEMILD